MKKIHPIFSIILAFIITIITSISADAHGMVKGKIYDCCKATSLAGPISKVSVKITEASDEYWYGQLILFDRNGNIMYRGKTSSENNLADDTLYGQLWGRSWAEAVCDIDMDGSMEIIIAGPKSDVSPQRFTVLRWANGELKIAKVGYLTITDKKANWTSEPYEDKGWVSSLRSKNGKAYCDTVRLLGNSITLMEATLQPNPGRLEDGFKLVNIKKIK